MSRLLHPASGARAPAARPGSGDSELGVMIHMFYPDVAAEIREYLENISEPFALYISTATEDGRRAILEAFSDWVSGPLEVRLTPNRGRDIAPKLITFRDVYDRHPYILYLHSKKSSHESDLKAWRHFILETLLGSRRGASEILAAFRSRHDLGIIAPEHYYAVKHNIGWDDNWRLAAPLARAMGIEIDPRAAMDFPSGSMFWARSDALRPLLALGLTVADFPLEAGQINDTLAHAVERLFFYACEAAGYGWAKVHDLDLTTYPLGLSAVKKRISGSSIVIKRGAQLTAGVAPG